MASGDKWQSQDIILVGFAYRVIISKCKLFHATPTQKALQWFHFDLKNNQKSSYIITPLTHYSHLWCPQLSHIRIYAVSLSFHEHSRLIFLRTFGHGVFSWVCLWLPPSYNLHVGVNDVPLERLSLTFLKKITTALTTYFHTIFSIWQWSLVIFTLLIFRLLPLELNSWNTGTVLFTPVSAAPWAVPGTE